MLAEVVRSNSDIYAYQSDLAAACKGLGEWLYKTGAFEEAIGALRESCEAFEHICKVRPDDLDRRFLYGEALGTLGDVLASSHRFDESAEVHERAIEVLTALCAKDPANIFFRGDLVLSKSNFALSLVHSSRAYDRAVTLFEEARTLGKKLFGADGWSHGDFDSEEAEIACAYALREVGRDKESEQAMAKVYKAQGRAANTQYELARYEARGAQRLARTGGDARRVATLENRALASLQRALNSGFVEKLSVERFGPEFGLRNHPEFQLILLDLAFPVYPFVRGD